MKMKLSLALPSLFFCNLLFLVTLSNGANEDERKTYIVYMGEPPEDCTSLSEEHHKLLHQAIGNEKIARISKLHSYGKSFNGFAAKLLPHEADELSRKVGVVSVFPSKKLKLYTTRSWDFLGMDMKVKRNPQGENDTVVALLDTGIWIDSPSFNDEGYGAPPATWKGKCDQGVNFTGCNNKVIGARYFNVDASTTSEPLTPADLDGHGSHTSSTVAGVPVQNASLYGLAEGTARGGVPSARIAIYKVCWADGCAEADILAGFDAAIADGVDVISVSIGGGDPSFLHNSIAIGSFHAMKRGILTSCAGGNSGPDLYTIDNVAPWIMTVAASSIDRKFQTNVRLGDGTIIPGISVDTFTMEKQMYTLLNGALARDPSADPTAEFSACEPGSLMADKVKGSIMYCQGFVMDQDVGIQQIGGVGMINSVDEMEELAFEFVIPQSSVNLSDGHKIDQYINSTEGATGVIDKTETVNISAPFIASFSSRGPQTITLNILKPDIAAPGLDILAAYSPAATLTGADTDTRFVKYNVLSGTSMACPHAAAAAAYVKSFHPDWSPSAIKSALMTTAKPMKIKPIGGALASGSGQIDPIKALNPGLIYDNDVDSYFSFLCKEGYNSTDIAQLSGNTTKNCSDYPAAKGTDGLNYPSMHLQFQDGNQSSISAIFYRTVTYVGQNRTVYKATVNSPKELSATVIPNILEFTQQNQKKSFKVMLRGSFSKEKSSFISASLTWSDSKNHVKSPLLVYRPPLN